MVDNQAVALCEEAGRCIPVDGVDAIIIDTDDFAICGKVFLPLLQHDLSIQPLFSQYTTNVLVC